MPKALPSFVRMAASFSSAVVLDVPVVFLAAVLAGQGAVLAIEGVRDRSIAAACDWAEGAGISRHIHDHIGVLDLCSELLDTPSPIRPPT